MKKIFFLNVIAISLLISCSKNNDIISNQGINPLDTITEFKGILLKQEGIVKLNFAHYFKNAPLVYGASNYITDQNDTLIINSLAYRISNIQLYNTITSKWVDIGTYNLNDGQDAFNYAVLIKKVPAGLYSNLRFNIGVDSLRNHTGEQTGDLDPALGMYWSWTNGYIHYKIEGRLSSLANTFGIHIGGSSNVVNRAIELGNYAVKNNGNGINLNFKLDVNTFFSSPNAYSFKIDPLDIHSEWIPEIKSKLLPNMKEMISLTSVLEQ